MHSLFEEVVVIYSLIVNLLGILLNVVFLVAIANGLVFAEVYD